MLFSVNIAARDIGSDSATRLSVLRPHHARLALGQRPQPVVVGIVDQPAFLLRGVENGSCRLEKLFEHGSISSIRVGGRRPACRRLRPAASPDAGAHLASMT